MSYAGVERTYPNQCAPDKHDWNPRGDCHLCGVYRDRLVENSVQVVELFTWSLSETQKDRLRKALKL